MQRIISMSQVQTNTQACFLLQYTVQSGCQRSKKREVFFTKVISSIVARSFAGSSRSISLFFKPGKDRESIPSGTCVGLLAQKLFHLLHLLLWSCCWGTIKRQSRIDHHWVIASKPLSHCFKTSLNMLGAKQGFQGPLWLVLIAQKCQNVAHLWTLAWLNGLWTLAWFDALYFGHWLDFMYFGHWLDLMYSGLLLDLNLMDFELWHMICCFLDFGLIWCSLDIGFIWWT